MAIEIIALVPYLSMHKYGVPLATSAGITNCLAAGTIAYFLPTCSWRFLLS